MSQKITTFPTTSIPGKFCEEVVDAPELAPHEVLIKTLACGVCHSDCMYLGAGEGLILGHEPIGRVVKLGSETTRLQVGDIVGTSYLLSACLDCDACDSGNDNVCEKRVLFPGTGNLKFNGFADHKIADSRFSAKIPATLEPKYAGPLMCAGNSVFNAIYSSNVKPTGRIAIIGIGGLGHLAIQFAHAWGCHVTAISHSLDKEEEAKKFGAHEFLVSKDLNPDNFGRNDKFDVILDTVSSSIDSDLYLGLLKGDGLLYVMGIPEKGEGIQIKNLPAIISKQGQIRFSANGSRYLTELMLNFADRHNVKPMIQEYPYTVQGVEESIDICGQGKARYRAVLVAEE